MSLVCHHVLKDTTRMCHVNHVNTAVEPVHHRQYAHHVRLDTCPMEHATTHVLLEPMLTFRSWSAESVAAQPVLLEDAHPAKMAPIWLVVSVYRHVLQAIMQLCLSVSRVSIPVCYVWMPRSVCLAKMATWQSIDVCHQ